MRKILISVLIFIFIPATAFASGGKTIQNRNGILDNFDSEICNAVQGKAKVHEYGVRFTVTAHGCNPGHVFTVWGIAPDLGITVNCGGGIVLPNGQFKTICDVPMGNIDDQIDQCTMDFLGTGCAQVLGPGDLVDPLHVDFQIDLLTHDALEIDISMAQIRTLNTCIFFGGPDSCDAVAILLFPTP